MWGRKLRTFLTTLAIVFGAWLIFGMGILMPTMLKAFAAISTALGLLAGLYLSYVMVLGMRMVFPMAYSFPLGGLVAAVAVGLIFSVIAALIPARQAAGMEIVRAVRYE